MAETKISAGSYDLNKWLFGGYESEIITTIYGPAGSGKTNFCLVVAASQAKKGKKVIFIDTEGGFSSERFKQIIGNNGESEYKNLLNNILLLKPTNFEEQKKAFNTLLKELESNYNLGLIIVDGMTMLYRLEIGDANEEKDDFKIRVINKELAKQLRTLSEIARKKSIPIIITNQVYYSFSNDDFDEKEKSVKMVGGNLLQYWSKCLIELDMSSGKRKAILRKHRSLPEKEFPFLITNEGIKKRGWI